MLRNPLLSRARFVRIVALRVGVVALVIALSGAYLVNRPNTALVITPSFMSVTANPTTADGGAQWTNPAGAIDAGDGVSCASTSGNNQNLRLTSLGFAIPSDASISGVTVVVKGARTGAAQNPNRLTTSLLGVTNGTPKPANYANVSTCAGTADVTLGGSADLWGATISAAQVNSTTFGVMIDPNANVSMANVDFVTVTVHYAAATPPAVDTSSGIAPLVGGQTGRRPSFSGAGATYNNGGGRVRVYLDGSDHPDPPFCEAVVNSAGNWNCGNHASPLSGGSHTVKIRQYTDGIESISAATSTGTFTVNATEPPAPTITSPTESQTVGTSPTFAGTCSPAGATVTLKVDGSDQASTTCSGAGTWEITGVTLTEGSHTVAAYTTNEYGNFGPDSSSTTFTSSNAAPPS